MPEEKWYQNPEKASQAAAVIILALAALLTWLFAGEEVKKMICPGRQRRCGSAGSLFPLFWGVGNAYQLPA